VTTTIGDLKVGTIRCQSTSVVLNSQVNLFRMWISRSIP